jgi:protein-disulfide isomerase
MAFQIGAICINCVATYGINLLLALAFWRSERAQGVASDPRALALSWRGRFGKIAIVLFVAAGLAAAGVYTGSQLRDLRTFAREETQEFLAKTHATPEIDMARFTGLVSRGPADAPLTIVVAGDFQCHFCRALSSHVERLRLESPRRIRVVFLNAPVSSDCNPAIKENSHEDACWLAEVGECAALQGKFWQYHDYLYHHLAQPQVTRANIEPRLAAIGLDAAHVRQCLADGTARRALAREVALVNQLKLAEVPSIVINGHARRAGVYPAMLRAVVHAMLQSL